MNMQSLPWYGQTGGLCFPVDLCGIVVCVALRYAESSRLELFVYTSGPIYRASLETLTSPSPMCPCVRVCAHFHVRKYMCVRLLGSSCSAFLLWKCGSIPLLRVCAAVCVCLLGFSQGYNCQSNSGVRTQSWGAAAANKQAAETHRLPSVMILLRHVSAHKSIEKSINSSVKSQKYSDCYLSFSLSPVMQLRHTGSAVPGSSSASGDPLHCSFNLRETP